MELIGYASDFVSFLIENLKKEEIEKIKRIILFGSVARKEASKDSDIDIFIDIIVKTKKYRKKIEGRIKEIKKDFSESMKFQKYWKLQNINNDINIIIGKLEEWKLKDSMVGSSIVLYSSFSQRIGEGENKIILRWLPIKNNSHRVMINKKLFGYKHYDKEDKGLLEKFAGEKLGTNVIMIPAENLDSFLKVFKKYNVSVKIKRVFEYSK